MRTVAAVKDSAWTPDGTQPPPPPPVFDDPLAGLVTGAPAGANIVGDRPDQPFSLVKPGNGGPRPSEAMLAAMLDDDDEPPTSRPVPAPLPVSAVAPGMLPAPERRSTAARLKQVMATGERVPKKNATGIVVAIIMFLVLAGIALQVILSIIESIGLH